MLKLEYDMKAVKTAVDSMVRKTMQMDLVWDWPCGVAYYGVACAFEQCGEEEYLRLLQARVDEYIELGLPDFSVNACAMGHCLITLSEHCEDERYWKLALEKLDFLRSKALRFGESVLQHTVSANNTFPEQAWADTLFMAAYFMLRMGVKLEDEAIIKDALNQYFWHIQYLQNKASGLWYHGYSNLEASNMSAFHWGRANAWAAYTMSRVKQVLPQPYLYPQYMDVECSLRDQLAGLKALQTEAGLWRTVLDDDQSYEELSASCGIAAAMLYAANPLYSKNVQRAHEAIMQNITEDGRLLNVSGGTAVMRDLDGYRNIAKTWTQGWGQGLGLAYLVAVLRNEDASAL